MDFEAYLDAQSALLALPISAEQRPGVLRYLRLAATMAPQVTDFKLTPADESGSVFLPISVPVSPEDITP